MKRLKAAYAAFLQTITELASAIRSNTVAIVESHVTALALLDAVQRIEAAAKSISQSAAYLSASEREHRQRQGQRTEIQ
jgi:hypothetical protein